MATNLELSGAIQRTQEGNVDYYYGGTGTAWASLAAARAGVPTAVRLRKTVLVLISGSPVEYWWKNGTGDSDLIPKVASADIPAIISTTIANAISLRDDGLLNTAVWYLINDAGEGTVQILIIASAVDAFFDGAMIIETGVTGTYSLDDDTFTPVGGGSGTVTSVGLALPAIFSVTGSPVTGSGTLTGALAVQNANKVFAGPTTGADAAPTFRTLVDADIPSLSGTYEVLANKATNFSTVNNTLYPTVQAVKTYADGLVTGLLDLRGAWDASGNLFPATGGSGTAGAVLKGDLWVVSVAGTLGGLAVVPGDSFFALVDTPGQTAGNWDVLETNIGYVPVASVSGVPVDNTDPQNPVIGTPYVTLDRTAWDALVAANGLVAGWRYRVTSFYTFDAFGVKDCVVTADSVNSIEATVSVIFGDFYVPYTTDSAFNQGFFLYAYPAMALTGTQALAYISGYNWKFNNGLSMFLTDGSLFFEAQIQGSDSNAIIFDNVKALDISAWAAGVYGTYDPNTDTFTPNANTWAPAFTFDGTVVTSIGSVIAGKYSRNGNTLSYSIQIKGVDMDFTAGATGTITIADSEFPFTPTGGHVVTGVLSDPLLIGIQADDAATSLIISLYDPTVSLTGLANISITGQCLL